MRFAAHRPLLTRARVCKAFRSNFGYDLLRHKMSGADRSMFGARGGHSTQGRPGAGWKVALLSLKAGWVYSPGDSNFVLR